MGRPRKNARGPAQPCGKRHVPTTSCDACKAKDHEEKARVYRLCARDAEERAVEHRQKARDDDELAATLDRYAAEHEAQARKALP